MGGEMVNRQTALDELTEISEKIPYRSLNEFVRESLARGAHW
jgi:hypothetical protein